jgi:hypothetical protein
VNVRRHSSGLPLRARVRNDIRDAAESQRTV